MAGSVLADAPNWVDVTGLYVQEGMLAFAVLQFLLGIAGTIALVVTLRESRKATATAMRALHVQQSAERAVLVINATSITRTVLTKSDREWHDIPEHISITHDAVLEMEVRLIAQIENAGRTVALVVSKGTMADQGHLPPASLLQTTKRQKHAPVDVDGATFLKSRPIRLSQKQIIECLDGSKPLWFMGRIDYQDLFGEPHVLQFAYTTTLKGPFPKLVEYVSQEHWEMT